MDLVIVGCGGVGRQAGEIVRAMRERGIPVCLLGYLDDRYVGPATMPDGYPVLGTTAWLEENRAVKAALAVGSPAARHRLLSRLASLGSVDPATLVHPSSILGSRVVVGRGCIVYPYAAVDTDVTLGEAVIVNKCATIGHDTQIGACVSIGPGANIGGGVKVGPGCDIGIGASTLQEVSLGAWSIIGAGAVVISDIADNVTAVGVPAREIKRRPPGWHQV